MDERVVTDLARSGLVVEDMNVTLAGNNGITDPFGYKIPYYLPNGDVHPTMWRIRRFEPAEDGGRYVQPVGSSIYPYFAPKADWKGAHGRKVHYIVEGEKKAAAAWKILGITAIGIGGCHNWKGPKNARVYRTVAAPILEALPPHSTVEIAFDGDYRRNVHVENALAELCLALRDAGHTPVVITLPDDGPDKVGLDDWLVATRGVGFDKLPRHDGNDLWDGLGSLVYRTGVRARRNAEGVVTSIIPNTDNAVRIVKAHTWFTEHFWFNDFNKRPQFNDGPMEDHHILHVLMRLQRYADPSFKLSHAHEALGHLWDVPSFKRNPLHDYLEELEWDGQERIRTFFANYFNSPEVEEYLVAVAENWLTSLIARVYQPGCKADNMLILEGAQGIGKSRALRALGGEYYRESTVHDLGNKDFIQNMCGAWIYDINELRALKRSDHATIKSLLSSCEDSIRLPYGRLTTTLKRSCVIVGTTNESAYLSDDSGARRFWPVRCGYTVEVDMLERDRDQILAEAVVRYKKGEPWWIMPTDIADGITMARGIVSPYADQVRKATEDVLSLPRLTMDHSALGGGELVYAYVTLDYLYAYMGMDNTHKNYARAGQLTSALRSYGFEQARVSAKKLMGAKPESEGQVTVYRRLLGPIEHYGPVPQELSSKSKLS